MKEFLLKVGDTIHLVEAERWRKLRWGAICFYRRDSYSGHEYPLVTLDNKNVSVIGEKEIENMPYTMKKTNSKYSVRGPSGVHAKGTTEKKAKAQMRLLRGVEHGWKPTGRKAKPRGGK